MQEPHRFDVVSEALYIALSLPTIVKKQVKVFGLLVEQVGEKNVNQIAYALGQFGCSPYTVEVGVRFENMKVRIHGARTVLIFVAQTHISNRLPVAREGFYISVVLVIESMAFNIVIKRLGILQRFGTACGARIFA